MKNLLICCVIFFSYYYTCYAGAGNPVVDHTIKKTIISKEYDFVSNGVAYKIDGTNCKVVRYYYTYKLGGSNKIYTTHNSYIGNVTIPNSVSHESKSYKVVAIGYRAFYYDENLKSVRIPDNVTKIETDAFYRNDSASIYLPNSIAEINCYFSKNTKIYVENGSITLSTLWKKILDEESYVNTIYDKSTLKELYPNITFNTTQTTINIDFKKMDSDYNYVVNNVAVKDATIFFKGLCPNMSYKFNIEIIYNGKCFFSYNYKCTTEGLNIKTDIYNTTATTSTICFTYKQNDVKINKTYISYNNVIYEGNNTVIKGLAPNSTNTIDCCIEVLCGENDEKTETIKYRETIKTSKLIISTAQPKVISAGNVLISAETNIDPAETNVGFEWRRTDWTDDFASNTGKGYVNGESMEGKIKNLYTEKLWKYRPYYKSNDGTYYYGDWVGIDPTNTSWFEPTVHTYADFSVDGNTVLLKGYTLSGTDNVTEQGFKYWKSGAAAAKGNSAGVTVDAASVPADAQTVAAAGELMSAELTGLDYNSVYYYAAYVKTSTGETFYGEQRSFTIGDNPTGIIVVKQDIEEESQTLSTRPVTAGWFTLDGRKLQTAPTRSGIYIHNGRKVSVK